MEGPKCGLCGEPMPQGEEMFQYHGFSGPCPKPIQPIDVPTIMRDAGYQQGAKDGFTQGQESREAEVKWLREALEETLALINVENLGGHNSLMFAHNKLVGVKEIATNALKGMEESNG